MRAADALILAVISAAIVAGCGSSPPTGTGGPSGMTFGPGPTISFLPPTSFGPPPSPTAPDDTAPVVLDPTLLDYLPASVAGIAMSEEADEAAAALTDPALSKIASALDAGVAVDAGNGNLVTALVVQLLPNTFGDVAYRQWRDSFDEGACAAAGGVVGHAEATIADRQVFITSCVSSLHTYHVLLEEQGIVISASSIGDGLFGEKVMEGLRVPA